MPYRTTTLPVAERREELDYIVERGSVAFKTNEPERLTYRLHEALNAARLHGIEPYASLQVMIRCRSPYVYVTPKHEIKSHIVDLTETTHAQELPDVIVVNGITDAFGVVGYVLGNPQYIEYQYTDFMDTHSEELDSVYEWTQQAGTHVISSTAPLIIRRKV